MRSSLALPREIAYDAFIQVMEAKENPDDAVEALIRALPSSGADIRPLDRAFIKEVLFGSLRWFSKIYWIVQNTADRDLKKSTPQVRAALVLGTYQIFYMSRVPDRAAVNESVEYVKEKGQLSAASFVNGILRSIARRAEYFPKPDKEKAPSDYLSLQYAHPQWIVNRWLNRFSFDRVKDMLAANNQPPPITIRLNREKILDGQVQDFRAQLLREEKTHSERRPLRSALSLDRSPATTKESLFGRGYYTIQDEASQLISMLLNISPGQIILDACCAPGGKCSHIWELAHGQVTLQGVEKNPLKLKKVKENFQRLGHKEPLLYDVDFLDFKPEQTPDRILLDAPCSGLGVLRRHPEGKWHKHPSIVKDMAKIQSQLLVHALSMLKPGGELVYSVCSYEHEETLDHLTWLQETMRNKIRVISPVSRLPDYYKKFVTREDCLLIFSGNKDQMDGFGAFIVGVC